MRIEEIRLARAPLNLPTHLRKVYAQNLRRPVRNQQREVVNQTFVVKRETVTHLRINGRNRELSWSSIERVFIWKRG